MKLINKYIGLTLLSGALLTSCSDSFLQRDSLTESSSSTFWQTPNDAMMALTACYDGLQSNQLYNNTASALCIWIVFPTMAVISTGVAGWKAMIWLWVSTTRVLQSSAHTGKTAMK